MQFYLAKLYDKRVNLCIECIVSQPIIYDLGVSKIHPVVPHWDQDHFSCQNLKPGWLVVWNFFFFPYIGNVIIPTDELHHFSEG